MNHIICPLMLVAMSFGVRAETTGTPVTRLTDGEITQIIESLDNGEVNAAKIALRRSTLDEVKDFATMMIEAHSSHLREARALAMKENIRNKHTSISRDLAETAKSWNRQIDEKGLRQFDAAYVDQQVRMHEKALDLLSNTLIPTADDSQLKLFLSKTRDAEVDHLDEARRLQSRL